MNLGRNPSIQAHELCRINQTGSFSRESHSLPYLHCFRWALFQRGGPNPVSMVTGGRALDLYVRACVPWASSCTASQFSMKSTFIICSHNMLTFYPLLMWCNTLHLSRYRGKICVWIPLCVLQCGCSTYNMHGTRNVCNVLCVMENGSIMLLDRYFMHCACCMH